MSELTPESDAMQPEGTAVKSAFDKPLHQLTEDDIAQITREDCRRYLKEKGMRRPSWNKSQAIQQVIMLKTLLETTPESDAGSRKRPRFSRPSNVHNNSSNNILESVPKVMRGVEENSILAEEMAPPSRKDLDRPDSSGAFTGRFLAVNNYSTPSRTTGSSTMPVGQMTIFYCGKVNVYDDVPEDKAGSIMHIAASPQFPQEESVDGTLSNAVSAKTHLDSAVVHSPTMQTVKMNDDSQVHGEESNILRQDTPGPSTRKASVQRYLNKRKDRRRFKSKRKAGITSCASLGMYFNHQRDNQIPNEPLSRSNTCSPPQIRPPSTPKRRKAMSKMVKKDQ